MDSKEIFWQEQEEIKGWNGVEGLEAKLFPRRQESAGRTEKRWIFRGERLIEKLEQQYFPKNEHPTSSVLQEDNENEEYLETHLKRVFRLYGVEDRDKRKSERELVRTFQRKAALYLEREPDKDDILEWLAIMRHRGAPTRLLDWTYSFYVAVYFALNANKQGVVWALDTSKATAELMESKIPNKSRYEKLKKYFNRKSDVLCIRKMGDKLTDPAIGCYLIEAKPPLLCVYPVNPFRLNKRLTVQQGLFLMPGDITKSFADNLKATFGSSEKTKKYLLRVRIEPRTTKDRNEILRKLKDMNISNEALFPGLDGFARSVGEGLAYTRPPGDRQV